MKTEEKTQHTKGPIKIGMQRTGRVDPWDGSMEYETALYSTTDQIKLAVVEQWTGEKEQPESEANSERFVATWNACESIPTEALENGVVGEMREALENLLSSERSHEITPGGELKTLLWISKSKLERISAILAKAKGAQ